MALRTSLTVSLTHRVAMQAGIRCLNPYGFKLNFLDLSLLKKGSQEGLRLALRNCLDSLMNFLSLILKMGAFISVLT